MNYFSDTDSQKSHSDIEQEAGQINDLSPVKQVTKKLFVSRIVKPQIRQLMKEDSCMLTPTNKEQSCEPKGPYGRTDF